MSLIRAKYFLLGVLIGSLIPLLILFMEIVANINPVISGKKNVFYLLALALNMILLRITLRRLHDDALKGMAFSMFVSAIAVFNFRYLQ